MTHLTMEQILALQAPGVEPGEAAAREHLADCADCRAELERMHQRVARLKALPTLRPTRDGWPTVRARLAAERRQRRARVAGLTGLALAASVALALVVGDAVRPESAGATSPEAIAEAMERSQALEGAIDQYNPDERVLDGRTARIAAELEDRIAQVDRQLEAVELREDAAREEEEQRLELWRERVGLLDALVDVHVTRASNVGL